MSKVIAESVDGSFGLLPKHVDFLTKIVPCIVEFVEDDQIGYIAVDEGILVKQAGTVMVSVREAYESKDLGQLRDTMERELNISEDEEKQTGLEVSKLELGIVKSFYKLKK